MVVVAIVIIVKITPLLARNASNHRLDFVSKNEVVVVLAVGVFVAVLVSSLSKSPLDFVVIVAVVIIVVEITPFPASNASNHRLVVVSKNEVIVVLTVGAFVIVLAYCCRLCGRCCHCHHC